MSLVPPDPGQVSRRSRWQFWRRPTPAPPSPYYRYDPMASDPAWEAYKHGASALTPEQIHEANILMGRSGGDPDNTQNTAFLDLIDSGEFQAISYEDWLDPTTAPEFYAQRSADFLEAEGFYEERGYTYQYDWTRGGISRETLGAAAVANLSSTSKEPAPITYVPTSTTNPKRPRTVAAGWDGRRKVLTTIFRDGTMYNYYQVDSGTWSNFVRARSKGRFIHTYLDNHIRGYADAGSIPLEHREILARLARTAQTVRGGVTGIQVAHSKRGAAGSYGKQGTSRSGGRVYKKAKAAAPTKKSVSASEAIAARRAARAAGMTQAQFYRQNPM